MKQSLHLKMSQHLTMTPQLQQAIRLLQLSTKELLEEIQEKIDSNPMLEEEKAGGDSFELEEAPKVLANNEYETTVSNSEISSESSIDTNWDDIYSENFTGSTSSSENDSQSLFENRSSGAENNLLESLRWQVELSSLNELELLVANAIVDSINEDGLLGCELSEIYEWAKEEHSEITEELVESVLKHIQSFDPPGVAARTVQESLLLQLKNLSEETPWRKQAILIISKHIDLLSQRDYRKLERVCGLSSEELTETLLLIKSLNPRPGKTIDTAETEYVIPDVIVKKENNSWRVELNLDAIPRLRINPIYAAMAQQRSDSNEDNQFFKNNLQEARWFIKSLESRNETLLKVAMCIVEHQRDFFEHGDIAMKPLILADVAKKIEMHESTISRVTTQKYMHTPQGVYELKYFFSSHLATEYGNECSSTAIRALIRKLIDDEPNNKPLSDNKIAAILEEQGFHVARRTVAKYRELMGIPPSNLRKCLV